MFHITCYMNILSKQWLERNYFSQESCCDFCESFYLIKKVLYNCRKEKSYHAYKNDKQDHYSVYSVLSITSDLRIQAYINKENRTDLCANNMFKRNKDMLLKKLSRVRFYKHYSQSECFNSGSRIQLKLKKTILWLRISGFLLMGSDDRDIPLHRYMLYFCVCVCVFSKNVSLIPRESALRYKPCHITISQAPQDGRVAMG